MSRPKTQVRLLQAAEGDLAEIATFIAADNPHAAQALASKFEKTLTSLGKHPYLGSIPDDTELAQLGYRCLIVGNYLIFYTVQAKDVIVHRIIHGARDYKSLL